MSIHHLQARFVELDPAKPEDYELCRLVIDATIAYRQKAPLPVVENIEFNPAQEFEACKANVAKAYDDVLGLFQEGPGKARLEKAWEDWGSRHALAFKAVVPDWITNRSPILFAYLKTLNELIDELKSKHWQVLGIQEEIKNQEENQTRRQRFKRVFKKTRGPNAIARACAGCTALLVRLFFLTVTLPLADSPSWAACPNADGSPRTNGAFCCRPWFPVTAQLDLVSTTASQLHGAVPGSVFTPVVRATKVASLGPLRSTVSAPQQGPAA